MSDVDLRGSILNYQIVRGQSIDDTFPVVNSAGSSADLTGWTVHGALIGKTSGTDHGGTFTITGGNTSVRFQLSPAESALLDEINTYQIEIRQAGSEAVLVRGTITVTNDIVT